MNKWCDGLSYLSKLTKMGVDNVHDIWSCSGKKKLSVGSVIFKKLPVFLTL